MQKIHFIKRKKNKKILDKFGAVVMFVCERQIFSTAFFVYERDKMSKEKKKEIKFYIWQLGEEKNTPSFYRMQVDNIDGRAYRKVSRLLEQAGWYNVGEGFVGSYRTCIYQKEFDNFLKMKKWVKNFLSDNEYLLFYTNRTGRDVPLNPQQRGRKKGTKNSVKALTEKQKKDFKKFISSNLDMYNERTLSKLKFSRNKFLSYMAEEIEKKYGAKISNTQVETLFEQIGLSSIIPDKRKYAKR